MLETRFDDEGNIAISGRFDAAQIEPATAFFERVSGNTTVDLTGLEYISSAGLGILLSTQKRLMADGHTLMLANASNHIFDIFRYSGFDQIFTISKKDD